MVRMKRIAVVIPYFGKLPNYFEAWLISAQNNTSIDFLIFTDDADIKKYKLAANIKVELISFQKFRDYFQNSLNFKIFLQYPYKICDYRPMYGISLKKFLGEYDFWGFGDFDMILGDVRSYITDAVLNSYDRIYNYGALSLIKNTSEMNTLFKQKNNYKDCLSYNYVYRTNFSLYFDEMGGHRYGYGQSVVAMRDKKTKILLNKDCADVKPSRFSFELFVSNERYDYFEYVNGSLWGIRNNKRIRTFVYLHFQKRKMQIDENLDPSHFYIGPDRISSSKNDIKDSCHDDDAKKNFYKNRYKQVGKNIISLFKQGAIKFILNSQLKRININNGTKM